MTILHPSIWGNNPRPGAMCYKLSAFFFFPLLVLLQGERERGQVQFGKGEKKKNREMRRIQNEDIRKGQA